MRANRFSLIAILMGGSVFLGAVPSSQSAVPALATLIVARPTSVDSSDPRAMKCLWRVAAILQQGAVLVKVGGDFSRPIEMGDSGGFPAEYHTQEMVAIFKPTGAPTGMQWEERHVILFSNDPQQNEATILARETQGMKDVVELRKIHTELERAKAFAKACKEMKMPSLALLEEGLGIPTSDSKTEVRLALSDGVSFLVTRQDVPNYVRRYAERSLNDPAVVVDEAERIRKIQVLQRLLAAFHDWNPDLPDGLTYPQALLGDIEVNTRLPGERSGPELMKPFEQLIKDMETYQGRVKALGPQRGGSEMPYQPQLSSVQEQCEEILVRLREK